MTTSILHDSILIVDDEEATLRGVRRTLRSHGISGVLTCSDPRRALDLLEENDVSLVILDLIMPHVGGEEILVEVTSRRPDVPVIVITAEYDVSTAVRCMKLGAADYLLKPVDAEQLVATVERALDQRALEYECTRLREQWFSEDLRQGEAFRDIVTADPTMVRLFAYLEAISRGSHPVLITGETGTGKELVARALHSVSRPDRPFIAVNVAGLDDTMFSDTIFGHLPGAFTGADGVRQGMIEKAGEGILFLDEIGDLSEASQVKLMRLLQEKEYYALGSDRLERLRARIVAATLKDPSELRPDLYYRLRSYHLRIPPLRERRQDVPLLVEYFLAAAAEEHDRPKPRVPGRIFSALSRYSFPGNVRELQAMVLDALVRTEGDALPLEPFEEAMREEIPSSGRDRPGTSASPEGTVDEGPGFVTMAQWKERERENIVRALDHAGWRVSGPGGAAELLEVNPTTLRSRMKAMGIRKSGDPSL